MDGQQWVWVAAVLLGSAWAGAVVVFGRRKRPIKVYRMPIFEVPDEDLDPVRGIDEDGLSERRPRHL
ncbi:hypothetical protein AB6813_02390 [bacterium RCC_150]